MGKAKKIIEHNLKKSYLFLRLLVLSPLLIFRRTKIPYQGIKKILLLRHDRIGDMVLSTAIIKALKIKYPLAKIIVLASDSNKDIIKHDPNVDEVFVYNGLISFIRYFSRKGIDLTIDLFYTYELKQAFLAYLSFAKYRLGFENSGREVFFNVKGPKTSKNLHMLEHLRELISCLGIKDGDYEPQLYLLENEIAWAKDYLKKQGIEKDDLLIAFHPGGFYPSQCWPLEKFIELARQIHEKFKVKLIFFGENKDKNKFLEIKNRININNVLTCYDLGLRQFISILSQCKLLVCNNTGVLHIACALRIPTVSTMGPTDPVLWWPYGQGHMVIRHGLACSPCRLGSCSRHECMDTITVNEMLGAVSEQIKKLKNV